MRFPPVRVAALLLGIGLSACKTPRRSQASARPDTAGALVDDPVDPETGLERSCDFRRVSGHPNPNVLVDEFVGRAANGTFSSAETWLPGAVDCPGHEPGYDVFDIISRYAIAHLDSGKDTTRYLLTRVAFGFYSSGFEAKPRTLRDTVIVWQSAYGWRIRSPAPWNWILAKNAVQRGWVKAADTLSTRTAR